MPRYGYRRRMKPRRKMGNSVIHVPSTMGGTIPGNTMAVVVVESPSIFAGGSASSNIEAQDKDRTVNVGHHIGTLNINWSIRDTIGDGVMEFGVIKVERDDSTPVLGTHPIPSNATVGTQGLQQALRLDNPGKTFHFSTRAYTIQHTLTHKIIVSPAKYKLSKVKAGDHWMAFAFNRGAAVVTYDFQARYKEYE